MQSFLSLKRKSQGKNIKKRLQQEEEEEESDDDAKHFLCSLVFFCFVTNVMAMLSTSVESLDTTRGTSIPMWEKTRSASAAMEKELGIRIWGGCNNKLLINNKQSWSS
jgi:hypothetical protein